MLLLTGTLCIQTPQPQENYSTSGMTARHAQVKKKHHKHRYKVNTEMPALKIRALTMKYYVPKLSDIFHLSKEETTIFSYTAMFSSEIFWCQQDHQKQLDKQVQEK